MKFSLNVDLLDIKTCSSGVNIKIKVQPRASKSAVVGMIGDALKLSLTSPPVEGEANKACIALFADVFQVPKKNITIITGNKSRNKIVHIAGVSLEDVHFILEKL